MDFACFLVLVGYWRVLSCLDPRENGFYGLGRKVSLQAIAAKIEWPGRQTADGPGLDAFMPRCGKRNGGAGCLTTRDASFSIQHIQYRGRVASKEPRPAIDGRKPNI